MVLPCNPVTAFFDLSLATLETSTPTQVIDAIDKTLAAHRRVHPNDFMGKDGKTIWGTSMNWTPRFVEHGNFKKTI